MPSIFISSLSHIIRTKIRSAILLGLLANLALKLSIGENNFTLRIVIVWISHYFTNNNYAQEILEDLKKRDREQQQAIINKIIALKNKSRSSSGETEPSKIDKKVSKRDLLDYVINDVKEDYQKKQLLRDFEDQKVQGEGWLRAPQND